MRKPRWNKHWLRWANVPLNLSQVVSDTRFTTGLELSYRSTVMIFTQTICIKRLDVVATHWGNGSTAFIWKLCCHWPNGLQPHQILYNTGLALRMLSSLHLHWKGNVILTNFFITACTEGCHFQLLLKIFCQNCLSKLPLIHPLFVI